MAVEKTLPLESTQRFPPFHRHDDKFEWNVPPKSAEERRRRKNSPTACRKTWWRKCVPSDRGIYKDRHVRIIIKCPESDSPLSGRIHLRGLSLRSTSYLLQFAGGPYISPIDQWLRSFPVATTRELMVNFVAGAPHRAGNFWAACGSKPPRENVQE